MVELEILFATMSSEIEIVNDQKQDPQSSEEVLVWADRVISKWTFIKTPLFETGKENYAIEYLKAVDSLRKEMEKSLHEGKHNAKILQLQKLLQTSMSRLENEFERNLKEIGVLDCDYETMESVKHLRIIAARMFAAGHGLECVRTYGRVRVLSVREALTKLGLHELAGIKHMRLHSWETVEKHADVWTVGLAPAVRTVFGGEWRLCEAVFGENDALRLSCFAASVKDEAEGIVRFAERVLKVCKRDCDRVLKMLDMFVAMSDVMEDVERLFGHEHCCAVMNCCWKVVEGLGDTVRAMLLDFQSYVENESSKSPPLGGRLYPVTSYVMNYLVSLSDYKKVLVDILTTLPFNIPRSLPDSVLSELGDPVGETEGSGHGSLSNSSFSVFLRRVLIILMCKLDGKAVLYKDIALSYLFLMNNLNYIVNKAKTSELRDILGFAWMMKNLERVKHYADNHKEAAWNKFLCYLSNEDFFPNVDSVHGLSEKALKDRFKGFNLAIEEVLKRHSNWVVEDSYTCDELRASISQKVMPLYQAFWNRYKNSVECLVVPIEVLIKYPPEDLHDILLNLYEYGQSPETSKRPSKSNASTRFS